MQNVTANTIRNYDYKLFLFIMSSFLSIQREKRKKIKEWDREHGRKERKESEK